MSARRRPRCCALFIAVVVASTAACAGHSTKPKADAPATPPSLFPAEQVWKQELEEQVTAPVSADTARVYLPVTDHIRAFDRETGEPAWTADITTKWPLAVLGGSIYALTDTAIVALNPASGAVTRHMPLPSEATAGMAWSNDLLVVPVAPSSIVAWRTTEPRPIWTQNLPSPTHLAPAIAGDTVFAALDDSQLTALHVNDGTVSWTTKLAGTPRDVVATPALAVVASSDRYVYAVRNDTGRLAWHVPSALDIIGLLIDDARVYVTSLNNTVVAYDAGNGNQKWKKALETRVTATPRMTTDGILVAGANSTLTILALERAAILGTFSLSDLAIVRTPPAVIPNAAAEQVATVVTTTYGTLVGLKRKPLPSEDAKEKAAQPVTDGKLEEGPLTPPK